MVQVRGILSFIVFLHCSYGIELKKLGSTLHITFPSISSFERPANFSAVVFTYTYLHFESTIKKTSLRLSRTSLNLASLSCNAISALSCAMRNLMEVIPYEISSTNSPSKFFSSSEKGLVSFE